VGEESGGGSVAALDDTIAGNMIAGGGDTDVFAGRPSISNPAATAAAHDRHFIVRKCHVRTFTRSK
jgi:hypothetical protein